ncbi:Odorant receptor 43 [Blattella germanica]|nr:Odorant receptor 43 [Blattella germanica]
MEMHNIELPADIQKLNVLRVNIKLMKLLGLLKTYDEKTSPWKKLAHRCLKYSIGLPVFIFSLGAIVEAYRFRNYPLEIVQAITGFLSALKALIKYLVFIIHEEKFKEITERCDGNFIIEGNDLTERERKIIEKDMAISRKLTHFVWLMSFLMLSGMAFNVFPPSEEEIQNSERDYVPAWNSLIRFAIPFQSAKSPYFFPRVIYSVFVEMCACVPFILLNTMNVLVITYLTTQFAVLSDSLKNIEENVLVILEREGSQIVPQGKARLEEGWQENRELLTRDDLYHKKMEMYLKRCIKHHQKLLQFFEILKNAMRTTLFVDTLVASGLIAMMSSSFLIATDFVAVMENLGALTFITMELWFFCWIATRLSTQSEKIGEAIWSSPWYKQRVKFQQHSKFILLRAQKPVGFSIDIFGTVSLELFSKIMNTAYSYFTIIKEMI